MPGAPLAEVGTAQVPDATSGGLRVHMIGEMYSLTWRFSSLDGRVPFTTGSDSHGEPHVV
jgi:hypothetical protein